MPGLRPQLADGVECDKLVAVNRPDFRKEGPMTCKNDAVEGVSDCYELQPFLRVAARCPQGRAQSADARRVALQRVASAALLSVQATRSRRR